MFKGELTLSVAKYREIIGSKSYWLKHTYNDKRVAQLRMRAIRSIGLTPRPRYHKRWSRIYDD